VRSTSPDLRLITYWAQHSDWREPLILQIAVPLDLPHQERRDLLLFFLLGIPAFLLVAGLAGVWMSKRALRPVHDMTLKAQLITGVEKLKERIPVPEAHDEIHELAETFNGLLDRLDKAFASQDRFISNASHQLKTPLTILKGELERLRKAPMAEPDVSTGLESAAGEIDRLIQLVQDLLLLARLEAGRDTLALAPVRLDEVLMRAVARLQKLARKKNIQLTTHFSAENDGSELDAEVWGDDELLESMIENFIENAIKYSPLDSTVELEMHTGADAVLVRVKDRGPGVPPELRQKIFERFSRGQPSNIIPGAGLGLSIAAEIARIHGAGIELAERPAAAPGPAGTVVTLTFRHAGGPPPPAA
jgi:signal transduction histidine kinase